LFTIPIRPRAPPPAFTQLHPASPAPPAELSPAVHLHPPKPHRPAKNSLPTLYLEYRRTYIGLPKSLQQSNTTSKRLRTKRSNPSRSRSRLRNNILSIPLSEQLPPPPPSLLTPANYLLPATAHDATPRAPPRAPPRCRQPALQHARLHRCFRIMSSIARLLQLHGPEKLTSNNGAHTRRILWKRDLHQIPRRVTTR
jgi:hypothetical protein